MTPERIHVCSIALLCLPGLMNFIARADIANKKRVVWLSLLLAIGVLSGSAQTPSPGDYQSISSGNWSNLAIWERYTTAGWTTPTAEEGYPGQYAGTDDVWIQDGHAITLDVSPDQPIAGLFVGKGTSGNLQYEALNARTLTVSGIVTIAHGAVFSCAASGTVNTHQLIVETGIINQGILDLSYNTAGVGITFSGNSNGLFDLSGATRTNLMASNGLILDKGNNVLSFTPGGLFQVRSANAEGFLTIQSGTFSLMGANTFSNPLFYASTGSYTIPNGGGFRLDNPNATIVGMYGTLTNNGFLTIRRGTYNIGTGMGNESLTLSTGRFEMSGGEMNISGRFRIDGGSCIISGGVLDLATIGHANRTLAAFHISEAASLSISGDPLITLAFPNSNTVPYNDIEIVAGSGIKTITGGTIQLGTSATPSTRPFLVNSDIPLYNLVVFSANTRVVLSDHLTINNQLTLNGRLSMNNYNLAIGALGIQGDLRAGHGLIVTGTGEVHKTVNGPGSYLFPFANAAGAWLPVTLNFTGGTFTSGAMVSVGMVNSKYPQNLNTTNYLNRYWTVSTSGITNPVYDFTGTYASTDVAGNVNWITTGIYTTTWEKLSAASNIGTTIQAKGLMGDVVITGINAAAPGVTIAALPATICSGFSSQLTVDVTGVAPFTYSWTSNPAGFTSTAASPTVSPANTTSYTVIVTDASMESISASVTVTVNPSVSASVSIVSSDDDNIICAGQSVTFTATPTNGGTPSYQWYEGTTPVGTNSTYTTTGLTSGQAVSVVMTSSAACATGSPATSNAITTTVNPQLPVSLSITASASEVCAGAAVTFTAHPVNAGDAPVYQWRVNGNPVSGSDETYNYTPSNGDVVTCQMTSNAACATGSPAISNQVTITVYPIPTATVAGSTNVCQNAASPTITFTGNSGTAPYTFTYQINGGAEQTVTTTGNTATVAVPVPTNTPDNFVYSLVNVQDAHCSQVQIGTATVTVNPLPQATAESNSPQCVGSTLTLTASGGIEYHWTGPNGYTSGLQNPSRSNVTTNTAGTYTVTVTDANGCQATASTTVIINTPPTVSITANPGGSICRGTNVTFTARVNNAGGNPTYQWRINESPVTGETNSTFSTTALANAQRVTVVVTADPAYCSSTATSNIITMTVNDPITPTVSILESGNNICAGTSVTFTSVVVNGGSAPTYQWQINETNMPGATGSSYTSSTLTNDDRVRVIVTSNATCITSFYATSNVVTMVVNPVVIPSVTIAANPSTAVCPGTAITFTATPVNGGSNPVYQWFINNNPAGTNSPTFTSSILGNNDVVSVRMTSNASCVSQANANSNNVTVTVNPGTPAIPAAITGNTVACPNGTETYTISQVLNATSYSWAVPSGWTIQNGQGTNTITVSTGNTGQNGTITVNAVNTCGTSGSRTLAVTTGSVSTAPTGITITNNNTCLGTNKTLTINGGSLGTGASWQWYIGSCGGTSAGSGPSITVNPAATTTYYVRAVGTCNTTACVSEAVIVSPGAPAQPVPITGGANPICPGVSLTYNIPAVNNASTYTWTAPTGWTIASGQGTTSITVTTGSAGQNGNISVTAVNSCGSSIARTLAVTVAPGIPSTPGPITGATGQCIGSTGQVYSIAAVPNATTYNWSLPSGWTITSGAGTNSITVSTLTGAVSGSISVTAQNSCGTSGSSTLAVVVSTAAPARPLAPTGPISICPVATGVVYTVTPVLNATSYTWNLPGTGWTITSGAGTNTITVTIGSNAGTGSRTISVTASNACGTSLASPSLGVTLGTFAYVDAGPDQYVCASSPTVTLNATVGGAIGGNNDVQWASSNGGTFTNSGRRASATYTPSAAALAAGSVILTITTDNPAGTCDAVSDQLLVTFRTNPTASISGSTTICNGSTSDIIFAATPNTTVTYTINNGPNQTINIGASGTARLNTGPLTNPTTYRLVNVAYSTPQTCQQNISGSATIGIDPPVTVNAGSDQTICANGTVQLIGAVSGGVTSGTWSGGSGTFNNPRALNAIYTPGASEITAGTVTLTLTSDDPLGACGVVSDQMAITLNPVATVNAGGDQTICAGSTATMAGAFGGVATSGTWTSSGAGSFSNNTPTAVYIPSAADIIAGTVTLTYTSNDPAGPCSTVSDAMILTINPQATVNAGPDMSVCASSPVTLTGTISGAVTSGTWSGGTGSFSNPRSLTNVYTPSEEEISDRTVTLTLTSDDPAGPCGPVSDQVTITITPAATVNAGVDQDLCEGSPAILRGTIGGAAGSATWSGGAGAFSNPVSLTTTYIPANGETGNITLTLTTDDPSGSCNAASDQMVIHIYPRAIVSAGGNQTICSNGTATMAGSFGGSATSGRWTTSGGGTFSNPNSTTAVYTPGNSDISNGAVILTFSTDDPNGPCGPVSASMTLTINHAIQITSQPSNTGVCATYPADFTIAAVGNNLTYQWYRGTAPGGTAVVNTANITGAQAATLHFNNATSANEGSYYVVISGVANCTAVTSNTVTLNVDQEITITTPVESNIVCVGDDVTFRIVAEPGGLLSFQWRKDGVIIPNATGNTLTLDNVTVAARGSYDVLIAGLAGYTCSSAVSAAAILTVNEDATIVLNSAIGTDAQTGCISSPITNIAYQLGGGATGASITPLPAGITYFYNSTTKVFTISGTPTVFGPFNYTATTTGPCVNPSVTGTITVTPNSTITLSSATATTSQTVCISTAITPVTYAVGGSATGVTVTGLPSGVTSSFSSGVLTISGTPTVFGPFNYTATTTGPCVNPSVTGTITVTPNSTITLSSASATTAQTVCISTAITPVTYAVGGSATGVTVTGLPSGVTSSFSAGVLTISGTPTVFGPFNYTATITGPCVNPSVTGTITVTPNSTITLSSPATTIAQTVCISNPIVNITYTIGGGATGASVSGLPSGVTGVYNSATKVFTISGAPTVFGSYTYIVTTAGPCANITSSGSITISPVTVPGVISPATPVVCSGSNSGTLTLSGYTGTILRWESSTNGGASWTPIANITPTQDYSNLTQSTLYRAVIQSGNCQVAYSPFANVVVISPYSPTITTNPNPPIICVGQSATFTASSGPLDGPFVGSFGNANPEGWRVNGGNNNFSSSPANEQPGPWGRATNDRTYYGVNYYSNGGPFSVVNGPVTSTLETPVFSLVGMTSAFYNTIQAIRLANGASARIEISTDGGNTYNTTLAQYTGPISVGNNAGLTNFYFNLASFLGQTSLRIRYSFTGTVNSTWAIDDAITSATPGGNPYANLVTYTWTPSATLSSATGLSVTATPPVTTTYTLVASISAGGVTCQIGTNQVTVTVVPLPVVTAVNACVGGGTVTFTQAEGPAGGTWRVSGGGTINASTGVFTPSSPGCFTVTYTTPQGNCSDNESFVVFPAAPVLTPTANACAAALTLPAVPAVAGFNVEYSIDGGSYVTAPTTAVPGCHSIKARYILASACGTNLAGTTAPAACAESNTVNVIIFPSAPSAPVVNSGCGPITVTAPPAVPGFDIQYSFDDGATWGGNTPPTTDNCTGYNIRSRYITHDACGTQLAGTFSTVAGCGRSPATNRRIDTTPPVIATTAVNNSNLGCNPTVTAPVFTVTELCDANPIATVTTLGPTNTGCAYTQTWTANYTDACNNAATPVSRTYSWTQDLVAPVITCPVNGTVTVAVNSGSSYLHSGTAWDATATDNCTVSIIEYTLSGATATPMGIHTSLDKVAFNTGTTTVKWTATDACGNTSSCSFDVFVPGEADIAVVKTGPATIAAGETITYTLTVTNLGPAQANSVSLADAVPAGITNVEYSVNGGLTYQPWPGSLEFTNLQAGADHAQTILIRGVAACPAAANSTLSNTATVTVAGPLVDPVITNNSSTVVTNLRDAQPPTFTLINNTLRYCVSNIMWATYNPNPTVGIVPEYNDITTPRPEYYLFTAGSSTFDLDAIANNFNDNCCADNSLVLHWRIDFSDTPNPATPAHEMVSFPSITGTGQPSAYVGNIQFPGDGVTFHDVIHQLTYWLVDCNDNTSPEQHVQIIIQPRPQLTKVN